MNEIIRAMSEAELRAKIKRLEDLIQAEQDKREIAYLRGMIDGLKFSVRCNGVSGMEVKE